MDTIFSELERYLLAKHQPINWSGYALTATVWLVSGLAFGAGLAIAKAIAG